MFQTKDFVSIVAGMVNRIRATTSQLTDFNVGSRTRTQLEAVAQELDSLYQAMLAGLLEAIPVSTYTSFGFDALVAQAASGTVVVTLTAQATAFTIPAGTTATPTGYSTSFAVSQDTTVAAGATSISLSVAAASTGTAGNIAAGTEWTFSPSITGFSSATNTVVFSNGTDDETAAEQKIRFQEYITTIARGTPAAIKYAAKKGTVTDSLGNVTERVKLCGVVEPWKTDSSQPIGLVHCYIHNGTGSTSADLVTSAQNYVDGYYTAAGTAVLGYKAAGVRVVVMASADTAIPVTATISIASGYTHDDVVANVKTAISTYLAGLDIGEAVSLALIYKAITGVAGVADAVMTAPATASTAIATGCKAVPGALTIA